MESGDAANTWIGLWSRESASEAMKTRPNLHYTSSKVFVHGGEAVLLGQYAKDGFLSMRFVKEDGRWKIKDFVFSDKAYPQNRLGISKVFEVKTSTTPRGQGR